MEETDYTIWDAVQRLDARIDVLKEETAEWIDELQNEDMRQAARIVALEDRHDALVRRVAELEGKMAEYLIQDEDGKVRPGEVMFINPYDAACTCGAGGGPSEHHDKNCPKYIPF